jgi:DNA polymerase-1
LYLLSCTPSGRDIILPHMSQSERPILIVDAMNLFVRSYSAYPTMSTHGYQMGGTIGFLKTLRRITNECAPTNIYIAWEGGGSQKRRALYSEYKLGRKPEKLNRFYGDDIPDSEENRKHQIISLLSMLKCAPVCQLYLSDCEGDDIVAYLTRGPLKDKPKIIVSADKDMYQLLGEKTSIYSLHKKKVLNVSDILEEFHVHPHNFGLAKALCGDPSDNIPGIKGVGWKTAAKLLPILCSEDDLILDDLFAYCHSHVAESSLYKRIIDNEDTVRLNWRLVYLDGSMLSHHQSAQIDGLLDTFSPAVNRMGLIKQLIKEGVGDFDVSQFMMSFSCIDNFNNARIE